MQIPEYASLAKREKTYFWHVGRREILREALNRNLLSNVAQSILDVGCGPGANIFLLQQFGNVTGLDISMEALKFAEEFPFEKLIQADATALPFADCSFDLVSTLDVLEHIQNDKEAIKEVFRVLCSGGTFLVTVPAFQWLFSQHDLALHHIRRYTKKDLSRILVEVGFEIREASYFVMPAVFVNFFRSLIDKFKPVGQPHVYDIVFPPLLNSILLGELRLEKILLRHFPLPLGTSIMIVARRP